MEKGNKIKILIAIAYAVIVSLFLWLFFSKFSLNDLTSYEFIKNNRDYLIELKENNLTILSIFFFYYYYCLGNTSGIRYSYFFVRRFYFW